MATDPHAESGVVGRVVIVQHGEKVPSAGDPGLTDRGCEQVRAAARWIAGAEQPAVVWSSPLRRGRGSAAVLAEEVGVEAHQDPRPPERGEWGGGGGREGLLLG